MSRQRRQMLTAEELELSGTPESEPVDQSETDPLVEEPPEDPGDYRFIAEDASSDHPVDVEPPVRDEQSTRPSPGTTFVHDVPVEVQVVLGHRRMTIRELLELGPGSVVGLDKAPGDPADVFVNGRLVARGEIVVEGLEYGIKITDVITPDGTAARSSGPPADGTSS